MAGCRQEAGPSRTGSATQREFLQPRSGSSTPQDMRSRSGAATPNGHARSSKDTTQVLALPSLCLSTLRLGGIEAADS